MAQAEHPVDVTLSAARATLMMALSRSMPPRVMTLDGFVPVVPVAPAEHPVDVTVSAAGNLEDDAMYGGQRPLFSQACVSRPSYSLCHKHMRAGFVRH